jgi:hypothetical protein
MNMQRRISWPLLIVAIVVGLSPFCEADAAAPAPVTAPGHSVDWLVVFKFNAGTFQGCGTHAETRACPFGGKLQSYTYGQQFAYATNEHASLQDGDGCAGETTSDPLGATFDEIYEGSLHYVVWNDQFYDDPSITGCGTSCSSPWGHSKGVLAWDDSGAGVVLQVSTPSWPASGNKAHPRKKDGNTLGCVIDDDVKVSQHFFSLKLNKSDVIAVLNGLKNAGIVTDTSNPQIVSNGGPTEIKSLVAELGHKSAATEATTVTLSRGVELISKPSKLHVPPWQMVSALLGGVPLRTATWWTNPAIPTTTTAAKPACWDAQLPAPGPVEVATSGQWRGKRISLKGGPGNDANHAKIGVSTSVDSDYAIFGDLNQQGTLAGDNCGSSQNGRGGMFFVVKNHELAAGIRALITGDTAPDR